MHVCKAHLHKSSLVSVMLYNYLLEPFSFVFSMYVCMYACTVFMHFSICTWLFTYVSTSRCLFFVSICMYVSTYMNTKVNLHMYVYMYLCIYICMYVTADLTKTVCTSGTYKVRNLSSLSYCLYVEM